MSFDQASPLQSRSFWQHAYGEYSPNSPLAENLKADVAIVGGGASPA